MDAESPTRDFPEYAVLPLRRFLAYWEESSRLLHTSMKGISSLRGFPKIIEVLADTAPQEEKAKQDPEAHRLSLQRAKSYARFAEKEIESGFPLLHAHTLVGAWGALEAAIDDMLVGMLTNEPELLQSEPFRRIKVPLADFESLDKEERMRVIIDDLSRAHGTQGVSAFESLLANFGLSAKVEDGIQKDIWEANHVRNVIVHRGSVADRRLVKSCPWMGLKSGDHVIVTHENLYRYGASLANYVLAIIYRLAKRYSVDVDAKIARVTEAKKKSGEDHDYEY